MLQFTRRSFIKCSALASLALLPGNPFARQSACAASLLTPENYYLAHKKELTDAFIDTLQGVAQFLEPELGTAQTKKVTQQALSRFEALLPQLPDVGGERNPDTEFIPIAAWYIALYEPMKAAGKTPADLGKLIYDLNVFSLSSYPPAQALSTKENLFSPAGLNELRDWAAWTQRRELSGNWVATFIPSEGQNFDYGINYTECGLVKYLKSQGLSELSPYVCLNDFPKSQILGTGLQRTKTIANGDGICNFRYKKDRPVTQNWSTEIAGIHTRK